VRRCEPIAPPSSTRGLLCLPCEAHEMDKARHALDIIRAEVPAWCRSARSFGER